MRKNLFLVLLSVLLLASGLAGQEEKEKKVLKSADILLMAQNHSDDETLVEVIGVPDRYQEGRGRLLENIGHGRR